MTSQQEPHKTIKPLVDLAIEELRKHYWAPMWEYIKEHPELAKTFPAFLLNPEQIIMYIGKTHIAIEYLGPERVESLKLKGVTEIRYHDYAETNEYLFEKIVGFKYDSTVPFKLPIPPLSEDLILPTNRGFDKLLDLGWNFAGQDSMFGINAPAPLIPEGQFVRIINGLFFDANESGLLTRHIKWIDFMPIHYDDSDSEVDKISIDFSLYSKLIKSDAHYTYYVPEDYKYSKLPKLNRFIELWGNKNTTEPEITKFLSNDDNSFILSMRFGAKYIYSELTCEWQSESRDSIRPDFFIEQPDGYADIVEFKLPNLKNSPMVGRNNRETLSAEMSSYISQTRVYSTYFDDLNNRRWFEEKYGFKVNKPRRYLVIGRRSDFDSDEWREIKADYNNLEIMSYDDLVDGVVAQFYK
ncbi:hypothetical protein BMS3Bbin08_01290 [bacterium BMS3Bbin08]|nr:hypothetical protein BMS3Bbin08_01290 [bacterium BMS3Bbin08]